MATGSGEGLKSDEIRGALREALGGRAARLEDLLSRAGGALDPRPNLKLAAAFGAELAAEPGTVTLLLSRLGGDDAAPDTARVFLPIAAAHGWAGRLRAGRDEEAAWAALAELAADERAPVRIGVLDALLSLTVADGAADTLIARAVSWLDIEDRELRFGAAALVIETLGDPRVFARVSDPQAMFDYLSRVIAEIADAPRSAERSDARRRVLLSLPRTLIAVVARGGDSWFEEECRQASHHDVRHALSTALARLAGAKSAVVDTLRRSLASTSKPPRDPSRIRPGTGRGKASRRIR